MSSPSLLRETSSALPRERLGLLLGFIGMAIFGGTLPATRIAVSAIDPIAMTALRTAIAGLCSLALLIVLRRPLPPRRLWFQLVIAMLCVSILFPFLMALAVQTVDASHGGVVMGALPIATALVAVLITHERPKPMFWIASIAGATLVVAFALRQGGGALAVGKLQPGGKQRTLVHGVAPGQHAVHILEHGSRADVGEKAQPAAVDPQQRHRMSRHQARGIQQGAVAADGHDQIGPRGEGLFGAGQHAVGLERQPHPWIDQRAYPASIKMCDQAQHAFGDAQILGVADQRDGFEGLGHK